MAKPFLPRLHPPENCAVCDHFAESRRINITEGLALVRAVGHKERFNPAVRELRHRLALGEIGEVYQIATGRQGSFPHRIGDVGVAKDLATHDVDVTSWVLGSDYQHIYRRLARKSERSREEMILATGRLESGVLVNHVVNWLSPMKERVVTVTGDSGTFIADTVAVVDDGLVVSEKSP